MNDEQQSYLVFLKPMTPEILVAAQMKYEWKKAYDGQYETQRLERKPHNGIGHRKHVREKMLLDGVLEAKKYDEKLF